MQTITHIITEDTIAGPHPVSVIHDSADGFTVASVSIGNGTDAQDFTAEELQAFIAQLTDAADALAERQPIPYWPAV